MRMEPLRPARHHPALLGAPLLHRYDQFQPEGAAAEDDDEYAAYYE